MDISLLLACAAACVVLNAVPGPGWMFILSTGLAKGPRAGVVAALGMASGTLVHTVAAALGLSALLRAAPVVLDAVRIAGAVFLVYLAISTLRGAATVHNRPSTRRTYAMAILTNLANPKVILFYLAFVPQFLTPGGLPIWTQMLILGALVTAIGLVMDCAVALFSGRLSTLLRARPAFRRWLARTCAAILGALAVRLALDTR
jgi:threonine/homoserine/homoserine lactone efflux protein